MENENKPLEYNKSLTELLDSINEDKEEMQQQVFNKEKEEIPSREEKENKEIENEDNENIITDIPNLADLIVGLIDIGFNSIATSFTKVEDKEKYRLENEEQKQLIKAWKLYLKNTPDFKMSPSTILLLSMGIVYAPKIITIFQDKKKLELEKENQILQEKLNLEMLKKQKQNETS